MHQYYIKIKVRVKKYMKHTKYIIKTFVKIFFFSFNDILYIENLFLMWIVLRLHFIPYAITLTRKI